MEINSAQREWQSKAVAVLLGRKIEIEDSFEVFAGDARSGGHD